MPYLKYSKPVLASVNPGNDLIEMIDNGNFGLSCVAREREEFISNVISLSKDENQREILGNNGNKFLIKFFNVENAASQILRIVNTPI